MKQITEAEWLGPYAEHPAAQAGLIRQHGATLLAALNEFVALAVEDGVDVEENPALGSEVSGQGNGGFRPPDCPVGAPSSAHKDGRAIDLYDPRRALARWALSRGAEHAERLGLYFEHPQWTRSWLHVQIGAPRSGSRWFIPYSDLHANPPTCAPLPEQRDAEVREFAFTSRSTLAGRPGTAGFGVLEIVAVLVAVAVVVGAIAGLVSTVRTFVENVDRAGYDRGVETTAAATAKRDREAIRSALARVLELEKQARAKEAAGAKAIADEAAAYEKGKRDAQGRSDRFIDDVLAGRIRLRIPGTATGPGTGSADGGGSADGKAATAAGCRDGSAGAELPPQLGADLFREADRADSVVRQLTLAQGTIRNYLRICGQVPEK